MPRGVLSTRDVTIRSITNNTMIRRSSSSCLLPSRRYGSSESLCSQQQQQRITIISTRRLPSYSVERYYMLSELQGHACSLQYLQYSTNSDTSTAVNNISDSVTGPERQQQPHEHETHNTTAATTASSSVETVTAPASTALVPSTITIHPSQHVFLYILWNPLQQSAKELLDIMEDAILYIRAQEHQQHQNQVTAASAATTAPCNVIQTDHSTPTSTNLTNLLVPPTTTPTTTNTGVKIHLVVERIRPISHNDSLHTATLLEETSSLFDDTSTTFHEHNDYDLGIDEQPQQQQHTSANECLTDTAENNLINMTYSELPTSDADIAPTSTIDQQSNLLYHHRTDHRAVETFSRIIAKSPIMRSHVDGITIGFANEVRAAPALEAILSAVSYGAQDRRRIVKAMASTKLPLSSPRAINNHNDSQQLSMSSSSTQQHQQYQQEERTKTPNNNNNSGLIMIDDNVIDPKKSNITVITMSHQDFIGLDTTGETDAAQGIMQSLTKIEWNGNGDFMSFASRAHLQWKQMHGFGDMANEKDISRYIPDAAKEGDAAATLMVVFLLVAVFAYIVQSSFNANPVYVAEGSMSSSTNFIEKIVMSILHRVVLLLT